MYYMMHETFIEYSQGYKWNQLLLERNPSGRIPREDTYFTFWHKQTGLYPRRSLPYTDYRRSPPLPPTGTVLCCPLRAGPTTKAGFLAGGPLRTHVTASLRAPGDWHPCQISPAYAPRLRSTVCFWDHGIRPSITASVAEQSLNFLC